MYSKRLKSMVFVLATIACLSLSNEVMAMDPAGGDPDVIKIPTPSFNVNVGLPTLIGAPLAVGAAAFLWYGAHYYWIKKEHELKNPAKSAPLQLSKSNSTAEVVLIQPTNAQK